VVVPAVGLMNTDSEQDTSRYPVLMCKNTGSYMSHNAPGYSVFHEGLERPRDPEDFTRPAEQNQ